MLSLRRLGEKGKTPNAGVFFFLPRLAWQDSFRIWDWAEIYPDPDYALGQIHQLLAAHQ